MGRKEWDNQSSNCDAAKAIVWKINLIVKGKLLACRQKNTSSESTRVAVKDNEEGRRALS